MLVDGDGAGDGVHVEEVNLKALDGAAAVARDGGRRHADLVGAGVVGPAARVVGARAGVLHGVAGMHGEEVAVVEGVARLGERVGVVLVDRHLPGVGDGAGVVIVCGDAGRAVAQLALGQRGVLGRHGTKLPGGMDHAAL